MKHEDPFDRLRRGMVEHQLRSRGITCARTLDAMERVARERFFPENLRDQAYEDGAFSIGEGQTISQPYMVAEMTQALRLAASDRVLEIGTGSGYQTAVLAEIARDVYTIERLPRLLERAKATLDSLGYGNVHYLCADGTLGWDEQAPFDAILVTAGAPDVPRALREQLGVEGRMIVPVGDLRRQELVEIIRDEDGFRERSFCGCVFVPLIGSQGWVMGTDIAGPPASS